MADLSLNDRWGLVDRALAASASAVPAGLDWLLGQTIFTGPSRRVLIQSLRFPEASTVVDVGCGLGAAVMEMAASGPCTAIGLDRDPDALRFAADVAADFVAAGGPDVASRVGFAAGDVYRMPFPASSVDVVTARFVFQHLSEPGRAAAELARVIRPGGTVCVIDVDDGLSVSEPPPPAVYTRLAEALTAVQVGYGGDRRIGRKLAALLDSHDLVPLNVLVLPQAGYRREARVEEVMVARLLAGRDRIVAGGHMTADEFDSAMEELQRPQSWNGPVCEIEAHVAVVAQRR